MKKHPVNKFPTPSIHSIIATRKPQNAGKKRKNQTDGAAIPPPDEATLMHLNKIARESPFCYYYKGRTNDTL